MFVRATSDARMPSLLARFGVRSAAQVARDVREVLASLPARHRYAIGPSSAGLLRPDLALPAYAGLVPRDGVAPIFNLFDRVGGGLRYRAAVTREHARDHRGGRLSYDEHDGTDFVCPQGTPIPCAAPGVLVATRDRWLRGGLTACVDHGDGVVTQYTHLAVVLASLGQSLSRGEILGLSGSSGIDMTAGFPWVPPHLHFSVWVHGRPVDPYLTRDEPQRAGAWLRRDDPRTAAGPLDGDPRPPSMRDVRVDEAALERVIAGCLDGDVARELARASHPATRLALCEDSLHHDPRAWPEGLCGVRLRPPSDALLTRLSLPMPAEAYATARPADAPWTRPASSPRS